VETPTPKVVTAMTVVTAPTDSRINDAELTEFEIKRECVSISGC
jgi:hypothetical protein